MLFAAEDEDNAMFRYPLDTNADLRLLEERHAAELYAVVDANREHLARWLPWARGSTLESVAAFLRSAVQQFGKNDGFHAGIFVDGQVAGVVGFHRIDWVNRKTTIGYWIAEEFQGRGLMTQAVRAIVDHALSEWKLNRVEISCGVGNQRSCAIPKRLGFVEEGLRRQSEWLYDHFHDLRVYRVLAEEWKRGG